MLGTTRFNTASWIENMRYREKNNTPDAYMAHPNKLPKP